MTTTSTTEYNDWYNNLFVYIYSNIESPQRVSSLVIVAVTRFSHTHTYKIYPKTEKTFHIGNLPTASATVLNES